MKLGKIQVKELSGDESAWSDFLISKAGLALASIVFFAAVFQLTSGFKELEAQEQLDLLARDFKVAVDKAGARNLPGEKQEISYRFDENEVFLTSPFRGNVEVYVSGEYVHLKAEAGGKNFSAVRPFAFKVLPFNESELRGRLHSKFGNDGCENSPLKANFQEVTIFLQTAGTEEVILHTDKPISIKKELVYLKRSEGVSAFEYILIYQ